jgi:pimeloyl-ACP methyl ester carboxylesterase
MAQVEGAGVALNVVERGAGAPVLVIHGMASDAEAWAQRLGALAPAARAIAFDRRGYGASGAPEPYTATTVQEQAQDAAAVLGALGAAPAVLLGEGFGGLAALDLLVRRPDLASGAVLVDPPLFAYVPEATEALAAQRRALEDALREGGPARAVSVWLGASGDGGRLARAQAAHRGFFADYAGLASWSPSRGELRGIAVPVTVVTGPSSEAHVVAAAEALAARLPGARRVTDGDAVDAALALLAG